MTLVRIGTVDVAAICGTLVVCEKVVVFLGILRLVVLH